MITVNIYDNELIAQSKAVSDGINFETVKFVFPENWSGYKKTAVFKDENGECVNIVLDNDNPLCIDETECYIPHEMLEGEYFDISVFGVRGDSLATTTKDRIEVLKSGYAEGGEPEPPTTSVYQQLVDLIESTRQIAISVRVDADNGVFNGAKGEKGDRGEQGPKGDKGDPSDVNKSFLRENYAPIIMNCAKDTAFIITDAVKDTHEMAVKLKNNEISDFSGMKIKKYGKNLLQFSSDGITFSERFNGSIASFPAAALRGKTLSLQARVDFTNTLEETATMNCSIQFLDQNGAQISRIWSSTITPTSSSKVAFLNRVVPANAHEVRCFVSAFFNGTAAAQTGSKIKVDNIMLELGKNVSEYEKYVEPTVYSADENGVVQNVISSPNEMTFILDDFVENTTIECEYRADTKKYVENKLAELSAMILEVY